MESINWRGMSLASEEIVNFLRRNIQLKDVCEKIVSQQVIEQAAHERGVTVTPEEIQAEADSVRREKRLEKAAETLSWLANQLLSAEDWEAGIRDRLLSQKLAKFLFDKEVEKAFAQSKLEFDQVVLYQIIVTSDKLAQELFFQLVEREISFYEAAHLYDIDEQRRSQCGYEGKLPRWKLKPDIAAAVFAAKPGEIVGPLQTTEGFHLIVVEEVIPAELTPAIHQELLDEMFKEWLESEVNYMLYNKTS